MTVKAIYDGQHIKPIEYDRLIEFKATLTRDQVLALTVEPWDERRTRRQQALLHELLGRYARTNGEPLSVVKIRFKVDLGYYVPIDRLPPTGDYVPSWRGAFVDLHDVYPAIHERGSVIFLKSEADYTRRQEREFIDCVMLQCSESGVEIADILEELSNEPTSAGD